VGIDRPARAGRDVAVGGALTGGTCRPARSARSWSRAGPPRSATGTIPRRRRQRSGEAGCTPATWRAWMRTAITGSSAAARRSSSGAARTSRHWRSRKYSISTRPSVRPAVVGVPDPTWGEIVHAYVARKDGHEVSEAALKRFLEARIAAYKVPEAIRFLPDLPMGTDRQGRSEDPPTVGGRGPTRLGAGQESNYGGNLRWTSASARGKHVAQPRSPPNRRALYRMKKGPWRCARRSHPPRGVGWGCISFAANVVPIHQTRPSRPDNILATPAGPRSPRPAVPPAARPGAGCWHAKPGAASSGGLWTRPDSRGAVLALTNCVQPGARPACRC